MENMIDNSFLDSLHPFSECFSTCFFIVCLYIVTYHTFNDILLCIIYIYYATRRYFDISVSIGKNLRQQNPKELKARTLETE